MSWRATSKPGWTHGRQRDVEVAGPGPSYFGWASEHVLHENITLVVFAGLLYRPQFTRLGQNERVKMAYVQMGSPECLVDGRLALCLFFRSEERMLQLKSIFHPDGQKIQRISFSWRTHHLLENQLANPHPIAQPDGYFSIIEHLETQMPNKPCVNRLAGYMNSNAKARQ